MKILFASSEVEPFSKTGGLADVAGTLPKALSKLGEKTEIITPFYNKFMLNHKFEGPILSLNVSVSNKFETAEIFRASAEGNVPVYFIRNDKYFDREYLYGTPEGDYKDNAERFVFFSRAILEFCKETTSNYDIVHCNDWHTGLVPAFLKTVYKNDITNTKIIFTIHNIGYQGLFPHSEMHLLNIEEKWFNYKYLEFYGKINFLKAGIVFSDIVTTVSKNHVKEIQTKEFGAGLEEVLKERSEDLYGILNGIDYDAWNPEKDKYIGNNFSANDLSGKQKCREKLVKIFELENNKSPIIGMVTRLSFQKGLDVVSENIEKIIKTGFQFVLLGLGEKKYVEILQKIKRIYKGKIGIKNSFDDPLAHKIYAGSDFFLMPSKYEPCGLNQMIAMKYGTIPIVKSVGGLDDTVKNFDAISGRGNGFKFSEDGKLIETLEKAIKVYNNKKALSMLIKNDMSSDFLWGKSAEEYVKLYINLTK